MRPAEHLLARLERSRESSPGRWKARCPAHDDKGPSLSIRELEDGRVLLHDFGGCGAADVVAAIGLALGDLFPDRPSDHRAGPERPNHWHAAREALRALAPDALLVAVAAESLAQGVPLTKQDRDALLAAAGRCRRTAEACR